MKRGEGEGLGEDPTVEVRVSVKLGEAEGLIEVILCEGCYNQVKLGCRSLTYESVPLEVKLKQGVFKARSHR